MPDNQKLNIAAAGTPPTVSIPTSSGSTRHSDVTVSGTVDLADAGSTVTVFNGTDAVATALVAADGSWTADVPLTTGGHILVATDANASGTGVSNAVIFDADTSAPLVTIVPGGAALAQASTYIAGTADIADAGRTVTLFESSAPVGSGPVPTTTQVATATVQADGLWQATGPSPSQGVLLQADGENYVSAQLTDAFGNTGNSNVAHYTVDILPYDYVVHEQQTIMRVTPSYADAVADMNRLNAGLSRADYQSELLSKSANTTAAALLLQSFISGTTPTSQSLDQETATASSLISLAGGNPAAAWQELGAAFADSSAFNQAYVQQYGALDDAQAANQIYTDILGYAPTPQVLDYLKFELSYYENYYSNFADPGDPSGVTRARGTMIGDLFQQIMDPRNNLSSNAYALAEHGFLKDAVNNIAKYGDTGGLLDSVGHTVITDETQFIQINPNDNSAISPTSFADNVTVFGQLNFLSGTLGRPHVNTGEGNDHLLIDSVGSAPVDAGSGDDIIQIGNVSSGPDLMLIGGGQVNAGDGNDQILIGTLSGFSSPMATPTIIDGGLGNDSLSVTGIAGGTAGANVIVQNLEQITLSPQNDALTINVSAEQYNSTIRLNGGTDTITIGAPMANLHLNSDGSIATYATVLDFVKGADVLNFSGGGVPSVTVENQSSLAAALADVSSATAAGNFAAFEYAADTYVYQQDSTPGVSSGDGLLKLAGITGLTIGQDLHFA
jgi:hypothetical protein